MKTTGEYLRQLLLDKNVDAQDALVVMSKAARMETAAGKLQEEDTARFFDQLANRHPSAGREIFDALARAFQWETVSLADLKPQPEVLEMVGREVAERYAVFPLDFKDQCLQVATANPYDLDTLDDLSHLLGMPVEARLAWPEDIGQAIAVFYDKEIENLSAHSWTSPQTNFNFGRILTSRANFSGPEREFDEEEAPIGEFVQWLIGKAYQMGASDIHLEPLETRFRVRFRIDGALHEIQYPPKRLQSAITSRLKLMADISISEKRLPQDGRILISTGSNEIDLRVSTLPTAHGESIVMRILDKANLRLDLSKLGLQSGDLLKVNKFLALPDGMILVTGPTGSGKTTTLYSFLHSINQPDRKIITVENPVEYQLSGINQVQVKRDVGLDFAAALRSILRQAPNIIMIGEIRDLETAEIAVHASLTGHLVFSTLHTNDSAAAISRLVDIGIQPFLLSASLRAVIAQRLVRLLCRDCRQPFRQTDEFAGIEEAGQIPFTLGPGCDQCSGSGYAGRTGIFEILEMGEVLRQLIYRQASLAEIRAAAGQAGLQNLLQDGMEKAYQGLTSIQEVLALTVGAGQEDSPGLFRV